MKWDTLLGFLTTVLILPALPASGETNHSFLSPDGKLKATVTTDETGRLTFAVARAATVVVEPSPLGVIVDGKDTGLGVTPGNPRSREIRETYPWLGGKAEAVNHCLEHILPIARQADDMTWTLEVRVFNDGVAYRYRLPGKSKRRITGEATAWRLPKDSPVWWQDNTRNYEGVYRRSLVEKIPTKTNKGGAFIGCPLTVELPGGGYALISEGCLYKYSGMTLRPTGTTTLQAVFQDDPDGWVMDGEIVSPWRVTIVAEDLNALVNSDVIPSLGEPPDPRLFPQGANTEWIRPGKGPCTWAVFFNDGAQWFRQKWFVDMCAAMNCEYLLVDAGWRTERWGFLRDGGDVWARLKELCEYGAARKVGIIVWNAYPEGRNDGPGLTDPKTRREFFQKCKAAGAKGVKIDFFDSESRQIIEVYEDILRETAELQLMVSFHGANKPTGETRTWPHEITREGLREQEYVLWQELPLPHYGALPFTRMVAGHGDFLPGFVRPKFLRNTTAVFQLATAVIFTSPFICWPDHPEAYLDSPFLNLVRTMPPVWDETRVLQGSAIGECVAFARRSGSDWYVGILNCRDQERPYELDLSFLADGDYQATLCHDMKGPKTASRTEAGVMVNRGQTLSLVLQPGGGFVGRFKKPVEEGEAEGR